MEDSPPTYRPNVTRLEQLETLYESALENPNLQRTLTGNLENLLFIWSALIQRKGQSGWLTKATDALGNPIFDPKEAPELEQKLQPFANAVLAFSSDPQTNPLSVQKGGAWGVSALGGKLAQAGQTMAQGASSAPQESPYGIDEIFQKVKYAIDKTNEKVQGFADSYGILGMERKDDMLDKDYNYGPIGIPFIPLDESFSFNILSKIPLPLRTIVFVSNMALDALRLLFSIPGLQVPFLRKMLSIGVAILELLQGDWKQALLSFAGTYSESALYMGLFGKVFLDIFAMINPEFQEQILDGIVPVSKSLVIGFLLKGFQILAPARLRRMVIDQLEVFQKMKAETDKSLEGVGLPPRPEFFSPNFEDIQSVQSFIRDRGLLCSKEYETFMTVMNQSIFIKLPFQMLGLPMDSETYGQMCATINAQYPPGTKRDVPESIVGDVLARQKGAAVAAAVAPPAAATPPAGATPAKSPGGAPAETTPTAEITPVKASTGATPVKSPDRVSAVAPPTVPPPTGTSAGTSAETPVRKLQFGGRTRRIRRLSGTKTRRIKKHKR